MAEDNQKKDWHNEKRFLSELIPYDKNPRKITDKDQARLKKSFKNTGYAETIAIDTDNVIVAGHQRYEILKQRNSGDIEIDVRVPPKKLTKKEFDDYLIASNKDTGEWDFEILTEQFEMEDLLEKGFDTEDFDNIEVEQIETEGDDETPEVPEEPKTVLGDIYEIGNHRLLCGDSTVITDAEKLMDGEKADMVFTDPPYGIDEQTDRDFASHTRKCKGNTFSKIIGDTSTQTAIDVINLCEAFEIPVRIFWGGNYYDLPPSPCWIVWDKRVEENQKDVNSDCELAYVIHPKIKSVRIFRHLWKGMCKDSEQGQARVHPTQKPIALAEWCFENYGKEAATVLDLFGGSGSTLIACEKTKRKCFMMELDPKYCDVIVNRYKTFCEKNGKEPKIKRNGEAFGD